MNTEIILTSSNHSAIHETAVTIPRLWRSRPAASGEIEFSHLNPYFIQAAAHEHQHTNKAYDKTNQRTIDTVILPLSKRNGHKIEECLI
jgi:hypothetical protein